MADFAARLYGGFDQGRQRAIEQRDMLRAEKANALLGQAFADPSLRQQSLTALAPFAPDLAFKADADLAARDDRINLGRANFARAYLNIQDPVGRQKFAQHQGQALQGLGLDVGSADFESQLAGYAQMGANTTKSLSPRMESLIWARDNGTITPEQFKQGVLVEQQLAPGASAPGITYVDRWNPNTQSVEKIPVLSRGLDYTGGSPSLGGGQPTPRAAPPSPPPGKLQPDSIGLMIAKLEETEGPLPEEVKASLRAQMAKDGTFTVGNPASAQPAATPTRQTIDRVPINQLGGGAIQSGPSFADKEAQQEREAAASARGRIEGERAMGPDFEKEKSLRTEFNSAVAGPREVVRAYTRVEGASKDPSAAGDLSMIFAYMKMLDPGSVVREGEFANAQNAAGVPDRVMNLYNRAASGERLNPAQRADFLQQAKTLRDQAQGSINEATAYYSELAPEYGIDPGRIIRGDKPKQPQGDVYAVGDIIEIGGRQYRATTAGADPELEEL